MILKDALIVSYNSYYDKEPILGKYREITKHKIGMLFDVEVSILAAYFTNDIFGKPKNIYVHCIVNGVSENSLLDSLISRMEKEFSKKYKIKVCIIAYMLEDKNKSDYYRGYERRNAFIIKVPMDIEKWKINWKDNKVQHEVINERLSFLRDKMDNSNCELVKDELINLWNVIRMMEEDSIPLLQKSIRSNSF